MHKPLLFAISFVFLLGFQINFVSISGVQSANNPNNDLGAVNHGDFIAIQWDDAVGATQYYVYTSNSVSGPWTLSFSVSDNLGGAKMDYTPNARLIDICYKVEATDVNKAVIKVYEPICVPRYAG